MRHVLKIYKIDEKNKNGHGENWRWPIDDDASYGCYCKTKNGTGA
jgi:hypothetical protein